MDAKMLESFKTEAQAEIVKALENSRVKAIFDQYGLSGEEPIGLLFGLSISDFKNRQTTSEEMNVLLENASQESLMCICCWDSVACACRGK